MTFIYDPATRPGAYGEIKLKEIQDQARSLVITVQAVALRDPEEIDRVFAALPAGTNALLLKTQLLTCWQISEFARLRRSAGYRLSAPCTSSLTPVCLMSYGEDLPDNYRRAASYADKVFRGAKPGDLPVQQAVTFELVVNLRTAKALGLTIPEAFLVRADEVIE